VNTVWLAIEALGASSPSHSSPTGSNTNPTRNHIHLLHSEKNCPTLEDLVFSELVFSSISLVVHCQSYTTDRMRSVQGRTGWELAAWVRGA